ncbi:MAG: ribonuclease HII [Patescibacteria group bacterium]|nr:ribonuclease HII [Patescibacteria group bacterium]
MEIAVVAYYATGLISQISIMLDFKQEQKLFKQGYKLVAGIDEAGRGPLAGPVVAACAVCGFNFKITNEKLNLIKDSKKLTAKRREELFKVIQEEFSEVGIGICGHETIDRINILQATFLAMKKAIGELKQKPDFIMLDGKFKIPNCSYLQEAIIKGDEIIFSIAAASIIAKVARDRIMLQMHKLYPDYGFNQHKGYGTKLHLEQLKKHGPCPIHRMSFKPLSRNMECITRNA